MPIYEYHCQDCHYKFEMLRPMSDADQPAPCPRCHQNHTTRMVSKVNAFVGGNGETRSISGGCASCSPSTPSTCSTCRAR